MKYILISLLLSPLAMMAMDQEKPAGESKKEDLYVGIVAHLLHRLEQNERVDIYPVASTTMLYQLPHDHTDKTTFEWVDGIEDLNPPLFNERVITTWSRPQSSISLHAISFSKDQKDSITTHKITIRYTFNSINYNTYLIPLGHAYIHHSGWKAPVYDVKPAKFGPAPTIQFLPGSTFEPGDNIIESTAPNESLMKCPFGNKPALTIAFLKMRPEYDARKQRTVYVPEGTQNKDHSE